MNAQMPPIGTTPGLSELFVGACMYSTVTEVRDVLKFVDDNDVDEPAQSVLNSVRALSLRGVAPSPQLVKDELQRRGKLTRQTGVWLAAATTSGSCASAARHYAAALVAQAFRRQAESFGNALRETAWTAAEADVTGLAGQASERIRYIAGRLAELRGGEDA